MVSLCDCLTLVIFLCKLTSDITFIVFFWWFLYSHVECFLRSTVHSFVKCEKFGLTLILFINLF